MSAISTYLHQIITAIWAKDVRQAIHDAISQCYDDVNKPALQTDAMQRAVQAKIDAGEMAAYTVKDGSFAGSKLTNGAITTAKLADTSVSTAKIIDKAVTAAKLADGSISTEKLTNKAVTTAKLDDGAVTWQKLASGAVHTGELADSAVTSAKLGDVSVTTAKIAKGAVTTDKLSSDIVASLQNGDVLSKLLHDDVPNTVQSYTFTDGKVSKVEHRNGDVIKRSDAFTYDTSAIVEVRTLDSGESLTITTNMLTLETSVTFTAA